MTCLRRLGKSCTFSLDTLKLQEVHFLFSVFSAAILVVTYAQQEFFVSQGVGAIRTATKRAGGTVHNHGGSPGKRLGIKKFSGQPTRSHKQELPNPQTV